MKVSSPKVSTLFLKAVVIFISIGVIAFCIFTFPHLWNGIAVEWPMLTGLLYPGMFGLYGAAVPFLFAMYQAFKLLQHIDTNNAFSEHSVQALRNIKYSAIAMTVLYVMAMPLAYGVAELDDAPGLILMAAAFTCAPLIVATFAAVLQTLIQSGIALKTENDLTV